MRAIRASMTGLDVSFVHVNRSAKGVADYFAKMGVDNGFSRVFFL